MKLLPLIADGTWREDALCREVDPELWFPEVGGSRHDVQTALRICRRCDVLEDCRAYVLDWESRAHGHPVGIVGGLKARERQEIILRARRDAA